MEELLVALLSAAVELFLETVAYLPSDWWLSTTERRRTTRGDPFQPPLGGVALVGAGIGLIFGALSLAIHRQTMLPWPWLRVLNVVAAPLLSGLIARSAAVRRQKRGQPSSARLHFWFAFAVTFALAAVRLAYGVRTN